MRMKVLTKKRKTNGHIFYLRHLCEFFDAYLESMEDLFSINIDTEFANNTFTIRIPACETQLLH